MQLHIRHFAIVIVLTLAAALTPQQSFAQQEQVSFQVFYDALSPYGQWVDYQNYGYVWIPDVGSDFAPYSTEGYWILTDFGWTWVSDYEWGWAPFHYGRWDFDNYYGWLWVPGNEWGPSWVNWRRAEGYYGWSPMEPGISLAISFGRPYNSNNDHWMFVRDRDFERRNIFNYSVNRSAHASIFRNSTSINTTFRDKSRNTTYITGPARSEVQSVTGRSISPVTIRENNKPGKDQNDGQLRVYRPQVMKNDRSENRPAPGRIEQLNDVKRPSERNLPAQPRLLPTQDNNRYLPVHPTRQSSPAANTQRQQQNEKPQMQNNNSVQPKQQQRTPAPAVNTPKQQQPERTQPQNNRVQPQQQQRQIAPPANTQRQQQREQNQKAKEKTSPEEKKQKD